jgi:hypothetical protein
MAKLFKRRVVFELPVDFWADSEKAMKEAIKRFAQEPVYERANASADGYYRSLMRKPKAAVRQVQPEEAEQAP